MTSEKRLSPVLARAIAFALVTVAGAATGCAPQDGESEGDLAVTTSAYGESTCGTAPLNAGTVGVLPLIVCASMAAWIAGP